MVNNFEENKKVFWLLYVSINILIFIYFYYFSSIFPLFNDDYVNTSEYLIAKNLDFSKIELIYNHVKNSLHWNARIGESLSYIFKYFDKFYYDVFISFINIVFINLVFFYSFSKSPSRYKDVFYLFIIFVLYISLQIIFSENSLWVASTLNHLFGNVLLLLVFIPYFYLFYNKNIIKNNWVIFLLVPIIYFISFMNSYTSVPLFLGMMGLSVLFYYFKNKKIPVWSIVGIISGFLGFLCVLILSSQTGTVEKSIIKDFHVYRYNFILINKYLYINYKLFLLILLIFITYILCVLIFRKDIRILKNETFIKIFLIFSLYFGSIIILTVGPWIAERNIVFNRFLAIMFFIVCIELLFNKLTNSKIKYLFMGLIGLIFLGLLIIKTIHHNKQVVDLSNNILKINSLIKETKSYPKDSELVILIKEDFYMGCLIDDAYNWCGKSMIKFYGGNLNTKFEITNDDSLEYKIIERTNVKK
ncbi:MAG: DUF6056 family protein [Alphaproteobacteria bacterium]|nr:DUF6056 family protein [Alphaproteobacteria bacterium]